MTKDEILIKLRELKPILQRDYAVKEIGLFGSFADDSYDDNSDIDLIVELEKPIGWKFFTLEIYLEKVFKRKVDLVTKSAIKDQIRDSVFRKINYV